MSIFICLLYKEWLWYNSQTWRYESEKYTSNHTDNQIRKQVILKLNHVSELEKKESIIYFYFLNSDKNYKNHIFLNLINKI